MVFQSGELNSDPGILGGRKNVTMGNAYVNERNENKQKDFVPNEPIIDTLIECVIFLTS